MKYGRVAHAKPVDSPVWEGWDVTLDCGHRIRETGPLAVGMWVLCKACTLISEPRAWGSNPNLIDGDRAIAAQRLTKALG